MQHAAQNEDDGDKDSLLRSSPQNRLWETGEKADSPYKTCQRLKVAIWILSSFFIICSMTVIFLVQNLDACTPPSSSISAPINACLSFTTALGRDPIYMSTDHGVDKLWNVYLARV